MICFVFKEEEDEKTSVGEMLVERLPVFVQSADLEVQERVSSVSLTLKLQEVISMYFLPTISIPFSSKQVMRRLKIIRSKLRPWSNTKLS